MNQICDNSGEQIKSIVLNKNLPTVLCEGLEELCNSLLIGQEAYLRSFKSESVVPVLVSIMERSLAEATHGDVLTMAFRALSLILEFVPSSYNVDEAHHMPILRLASRALHKSLNSSLSYTSYNSDVLLEECLRIIRFVGKDDRTGMSLCVDYVEDLLLLCDSENSLVARQGLETLLTLCSKIVLPSEKKKFWNSSLFGIFQSHPKNKSARQTSHKAAPCRCEHQIVVRVEHTIGPFLLGLIEKFSSLDSIPEMWGLFELALQCLGTLIERALLCYRPSTARAITYATLPALVFKVISQINQNRVLASNVRSERTLLCETFLTIVASSNRKLLVESLLDPDSKDFFNSIFEHTEFSITTFLEDPFTKVSEGGRYKTQCRDKDNIITISAIYLFVSALPQIPLEAFGRRPKFPLPVHHWMWEDEMRHANQVNETHCVWLEVEHFKLSREALIIIHAKVFPVDLHQMVLFRGSENHYRNIFRCFTPFVFRYVEEKSLRPALEAVKEAGPQPTQIKSKGAFDSFDCSKSSNVHLADRKKMRGTKFNIEYDNHNGCFDYFDSNGLTHILMNKEGVLLESSTTIPEQYLISFCQYASHTPGQMAKELAIWACAAMLRMCLLAESTHPRLEKLVDMAMLPLCDMFQKLLTHIGNTAAALTLSMIEWLLHRDTADPLSFCKACLRSGLLSQMTVFGSKASSTNPHSEYSSRGSLEKKSKALRIEIATTLQKNFLTSVSPELLEGTPEKEYIFKAFDTVALQRALNAIKEITASTSDCSNLVDKLATAVDDREPLPSSEKKLISNLFVALQASSHLTSFELQKIDFASVILQYLLDGKTTEDLFGEQYVFLSGGSGSTFMPMFHDSIPELSSILNKRQLQWTTMMNCDTSIATLLELHSNKPRVEYFLHCARQMPEALELLIHFLVESLSFDSKLPLVESVVFSGSTTSRTPVYAFEELNNISPRVALCSKAADMHTHASLDETNPRVKRRNSFLNENYVSESSNNPDLRQQTIGPGRVAKANSSFLVDDEVTHTLPNILPEVTIEARAPTRNRSPSTTGPQLPNRQYNSPLRERARVNPKRRGNLLHIVSDWYHHVAQDLTRQTQLSLGDKFHKDRVHLFASVGDIERFLRIGTSSLKGTQAAPASASGLSMDKLIARVELFLNRQLPDSASGKGVAEVIKLLKSNRMLMVKELEKLISTFQSRRTTSGIHTSLESLLRPKGDATNSAESPVELSEEQASIVAQLLLQAVEERYILYRPFTCGPCPLQSSFLSHVYHQCVVTGNQAALFQLENCLLCLDSSEKLSEERKASPSRPALSPSCQTSLAVHDSAFTGVPPTDSNNISTATKDPLQEPFSGLLMPCQTIVFHHFESDLDTTCSCGRYSRIDFASVNVNTATKTLPRIARCADALLLVFLHRSLRSFDNADDPKAAQSLWSRLKHSNAFVSSIITATAINSLRASALRVSLLPPQYALPQWLNFVFKHAYFLISKQVRNQVARFLAYGARRSLVTHMRTFRFNRYARCGTLLPGEWARMSNHKFSIDRSRLLRDAYTVLCKSAELRLPISVEFIGDLGVGQGPTAQFYTLLAKELSKERLHLWRDTEPPPGQPDLLKGKAASKTQEKASPKSKNSPLLSRSTYSSHLQSAFHDRKISKVSSVYSVSALNNEPLVTVPPEGLFPSAHCFVLSDPKLCSPTYRKSLSRLFLPEVPQAHSKVQPRKLSHFHKAHAGATKRSTAQDASLTTQSRTVFTNPRMALCDYVQHQREHAKAFYVVGAALARAFIDEQVFPLNLSSALSIFARRGVLPSRLTLASGFDLDESSETPIDLLELPSSAVGLVDKSVARTLEMLDKMDSAMLESLEIPFTLPGDDSFELVPGGSNLKVTKKNLCRYKRRVVSSILYDSVQVPLRLFMMGFEDVVPPAALSMLGEEELMSLLCGADMHPDKSLWTEEEIASVLVGDHGYKNSSPQLKMLAHILSTRFTAKEQRAFLQFCTGCPFLPLGGVTALGAITVVKSSAAFLNVEVLEGLPEEEGSGLFHAQENSLGQAPSPQAGDGELAFQRETSEELSREASVSMLNAVAYHAEKPTSEENGNSTGVEFHPSMEWPLPSVNTCFRYLKLPPYPTEELMFKKLQLGISYCGDTFELS